MLVTVVCFVLYLMNRLMQVKSTELSTPRGFRIVVRDFEKNASPALNVRSANGNVIDAFKTMNFHRSKMNEYLCDDFVGTKVPTNSTRRLDQQTNDTDVGTKLIQDVGSNAYKTWLMRISGGASNGGVSKRDYHTFGYAQGHWKKPFYRVRNNVEDKDIYFGTSFPAYHAQRYKPNGYSNQYGRNRTLHGYQIHSKIPVTLSKLYKNKHMAQYEPNENTIGVNLHGKFVNLTEKYRKKMKTTVIPREPFQRRDTSPNYISLPTMENVPVFVTQISTDDLKESTTSIPMMNMMMITSMDTPTYSSWSSYDYGNNMNPPTESNGKNAGYFYTTMQTENMPPSYPTYYPSLTESPRDFTYPPYYPPYDAGNGYNVPPYGYTETTTNNPPPYGYQPPATPPPYGYQPPSTAPPYGNDYTFNPPNNQNYGNHQEEQSWYMSQPPKDMNNQNNGHQEDEHWYIGHPPKDEDQSEENNISGPNGQLVDEDSQDMEDSRESTNLLGPDAYELILTAIAFMTFGTYFMNMMMRIMENNSGPTMMIVGGGGNNVIPNVDDNYRNFPDDDNLQIVKHILLSIEEFHELFAENTTNS